MTQNLKTEQAMKDAVERMKQQEASERQRLLDMNQKEFAILCNDLGIMNGSRRQKVEEVLQKMIFCR